MTIETATIERPAWIEELVQLVLASVTPQDGCFMGPLGYRWCEPNVLDNTDSAWLLCVYPTPNVIVNGGERDGTRFVYGFTLDLTAILRKLRQIKLVEWKTPHGYNGELDGPSVNIRAVYDAQDVHLQVFNLPPSDEPAGCHVDGRTGQVTPL